MNIHVDTITLRAPEDRDAQGFIAICSEAETMRYYGAAGANIRTHDDAIRQIRWCQDLFANNAGRWIITEREDDSYIGDIGFHSFSAEHHKAEIGYRLMRAYWGRGIMTNCISALLAIGFNQFGYNRVEALLDVRNIGCKKVLLKNNFTHEGRLRQYERENGEFIDIDICSILKSEYRAARS
ncbi:GNAT family N-acetyltransferase [Chloroflexia bacterium SDU3-3]|nr:GNAT family N-acetyltransferase [Chloroflexia bacterium SDU3-3]